MNRNRMEGSWKSFKGAAKEKWAELTGSRLDRLAGKRDIAAGKAQEDHGITQEAAEGREVRKDLRHTRHLQ